VTFAFGGQTPTNPAVHRRRKLKGWASAWMNHDGFHENIGLETPAFGGARQRVSEVLTGAGWAAPRLDKLDLDLDIAAGRGLEEALVQSTQIGAVNSWLRNRRRKSSQPPSRPSARRWRRIWTALACACPVRCGWLAARRRGSQREQRRGPARHDREQGDRSPMPLKRLQAGSSRE
jgi:hypothetical protein